MSQPEQLMNGCEG